MNPTGTTVDPVMALFHKRDIVSGQITPMAPEDWHAAVRIPQLTERVPSHVREIFDEARGMMLHGTCSLALFTRGVEHALKAADAAVGTCAEGAGVSMTNAKGWPTSFGFRVRELEKLQILTPADVRTWTVIRKLRNHSAHPAQPFLLPPAVTVAILAQLGAAIERLFA